MGLQTQIDLSHKPIMGVTLERKQFERYGEMVKYVLWFNEEEVCPLLDMFVADPRAEENLETLREFLLRKN
jgi:hypothetical protein